MIPDFENIAFVEGAEFEDFLSNRQVVRIVQLGTIAFPSGRVLVADAGATEFRGHPAFEILAPPGEHPVFVSLLEGSDGCTDVGALWVKFSDAPVHHWHPAYYEGHEADDNYDPGFGVDTGTACIADAEAAALLDVGSEALLGALWQDDKPWTFAFHPEAPETFVASSSGIGDGFYSSFWGTDTEQEPVYLVVDFDRLRVPEWETFELVLPLARGKVRSEIADRAKAKLHVSRFPIWGRTKLRFRGMSVPRVRLYRDGELVERPAVKLEGQGVCFEIEGRPGDRLEVSFDVSAR